MKKLLISAASLAAITSSAIAADLPSRKEAIAAPMPTPVWTGFYAGLNAGGTWGNNNNAQFSNYPAYTNPVLKSAPYQLAIISATGTSAFLLMAQLVLLVAGKLATTIK